MANRKTRDALTNPLAKRLFNKLYKEFLDTYESMTESALSMLNDIAMLEQIKQECIKSVFKDGVMIHWQNGANQKGDRDHPLIPKINQTVEQQRKLISELKLTFPSLKTPGASQEGGDEFEDF